MIEIPFAPNIVSSGSFTLSWHGLLSFVAVVVAVVLVGRWAMRDKLDRDMVFNTAMWGIVGGIIGARLVHVADRWDLYSNDLGQIFAVWEGGIGLWGAILGGWLGGLAYAVVAKAPFGRLMDLAAPAMLIGQTIGRVGDIINGEHWSRALDAGWGWVFTHLESPGRAGAQRIFGDAGQPVHPVVVYEMIWNLIALALIWKLRGKVRPAGAIWMIYLSLYAIGRFSLQWLRFDDVKFWGLQEAHIIAILVLVATIPWMIKYLRWGASEAEQAAPGAGPRRSRSGRRRAAA